MIYFIFMTEFILNIKEALVAPDIVFSILSQVSQIGRRNVMKKPKFSTLSSTPLSFLRKFNQINTFMIGLG